jgi:hypothetical protein
LRWGKERMDRIRNMKQSREAVRHHGSKRKQERMAFVHTSMAIFGYPLFNEFKAHNKGNMGGWPLTDTCDNLPATRSLLPIIGKSDAE